MKDFSNGPAGLRSDYPEPHKLLYRPSACKISGMILKVSVISHREKQHQYLWVKLDTGDGDRQADQIFVLDNGNGEI